MKIFPKESIASVKSVKSDGVSKGSKASKAISKRKADAPVKKDISANEIREKLAARVETSEAAKSIAIQRTSKKLGEGFLNDEIKPAPVVEPIATTSKIEVDEDEKSPNTKDFIMKSDIAQNDPKDSNTQEKLKSVISKGGFNFNPKEREALEKILANS